MPTKISRRDLFKATAITLAAGALSTATAPLAFAAPGPIVGTVIDYAAGVPSAQAIKNAGHMGAVRYVSHRRPGTENWMVGKPVTHHETTAMARLGLKTASVYQFGKDTTADWKQGAPGAHVHAPQAIQLHRAAGGPTGRPIYVAIDDNPSRAQYDNYIRPYLRTFQQLLADSGYQMGVYGNYNTIAWAIQDGLGQFFWQHDWGSQGRIHPSTTIHQKAGWQVQVGGVTVDVNNVYATDWGQWTPRQTHNQAHNQAHTQPGTQPSIQVPAGNTPINPAALSSELRNIPQLNQLNVHNLTPEQISQLTRAVQSFSSP